MRDLKECFGQKSESSIELAGDKGVSELLKEQKRYDAFCTPGHKGALGRADITEYDGGKIFPSASVEKSEQTAADHYGVKRLRFLVGGASSGIKAAIVAADRDIVAPRFTHCSVSEGARLIRKEYYAFDTGVADGLPKVPTAADYESAIGEKRDCLAVVTSPDYFGRVADIKSIAEVCKKKGVLLLVDAAHGAHFASRNDLFASGGERTADFAVLSAHKTLRAYTQSAFGVVNSADYFERYDEALRLLGTTSPSYPMLAALDDAISYEQRNGKKYDALIREINAIKNEMEHLKNDDPMRLVVKIKNAEELFLALVKRGIMPETYYGDYCVFIITLSDTVRKIKRLKKALKRAIEETK